MKQQKLEFFIHFIMSLVGGFLGAYAILNFHDSFGSAQTANIIYLLINILGNNLSEFLIRLLALIIYVSAIVLCVLMSKYKKIDVQICSIVLSMLTVIGLFFIPEHINDIVSLYPVFFITAFQWCAFIGAGGYICSSIFSTNNLRQFVTSIVEYLIDKNPQNITKMKVFGGTLLFFHVGVVVSYLSYIFLKLKGVILCIVPLTIALFLVCKNKKMKEVK